MNPTTENILGYAVNNGGIQTTVDQIADWISKDDGLRWLACINPHSYAVALDDGEFSRALGQADWLIPDGVGIVMASKALHGNIRQRVTGSDIFLGVNRALDRMTGRSVFFLGASEGTLAAIREKMAIDFPRIRIAGTYSPPFKPSYSDAEMDAMIAAIAASGADVLWVGLTSPKQDLWIARNRQRLDVKFAAGIGAVFDFYTGRVKRTPPVFQKLGLEWLPRLMQQPRRLWRRMGVSAPRFVWDVLAEKRRRSAGRRR